MPMPLGRTPRPTFWSVRSTIAQTAGRFYPKRCSVPTSWYRWRAGLSKGSRVDERRIAANLRTYAPFAGTQALLMDAARAGGDRQALHETLRAASVAAWEAVRRGEENPLARLLAESPELTALVEPAEIRRLLDPSGQVGTARQRARLLADRIERLDPFPRQTEVAFEQRHRDCARQDESAVRESRAAASARRRADRSDLFGRRCAPQRNRRQRAVAAQTPRASSACSTSADCRRTISPAARTTTTTRWSCGAPI